MKKYLLPFLLVLIFCSCRGRHCRNSPDSFGAKQLIFETNYHHPSDPDFRVDSLSIDSARGILLAVVSYSGGCKPHEFRLISKNEIEKSLPPHHLLYLDHQSNGDACRKLSIEKKYFDVDKIRPKKNSSVVLKLGDREVVWRN